MTKHVLVIDDEFANRMLPGLFLRDMGFKVTECSNAEDALKLVIEMDFTDVLLDISLPNISGVDILKALRSMPKTSNLRIIAYTAHAMPEETKGFEESGFDGLLIKPISKNDLVKLFLNKI